MKLLDQLPGAIATLGASSVQEVVGMLQLSANLKSPIPNPKS
jgi:hypothetical protein